MSGKILIVDPVSTNRIVLRVKMMAAQYQVESCASCSDAAAHLQDDLPDLILINLFEQAEEGYALCTALRSDPRTRDIAIISVGVNSGSRARFRALDAGVDDVLPRPINDALLLSRVRSLLRRRNVINELTMRDHPDRSYGFDETRAATASPARVSVIAVSAQAGQNVSRALQNGLQQPVQLVTGLRQLSSLTLRGVPDLFVIHGSDGQIDRDALIQLVCDLKSRAETCHTRQLIILSHSDQDLAAMLLDIGADDIMFDDAEPDEQTLRAQKLIRAKATEDDLRDRVRIGLRAAVTDPLTGLFNRRYAEAQLRRISEIALHNASFYAVIMLDIDYFKSINDRFGHAVGDMVLVQLAERLRDSFREIDLVARIGGEEFLIALPNTQGDAALDAGERLRRIVNGKPFDIGEGRAPLHVTASIGVAVHAGHQIDGDGGFALSSMFEQADAALYLAKSSGRNSVSMARSAA